MRCLPDGLTGAIMALEGIPDAAVMLHGPGGCRTHHAVLATAVSGKGDDGVEFWEPYYYGYPEVPATFLEEADFINGAYARSVDGLRTVSGRSPSLVVVIDSPGAALIGDDHDSAIAEAGLAGIAFRMREPQASVPATEGCDHALAEVMRFLSPERRSPRSGTVNLIGLSMMDRDWAAARDELCGYLEDMGLEVACCPGAGSDVASLVRSVDSELNVVVCPEQCRELSEWYASMGVPSVASPAGAPVGLDALEAWIRAVADAAGRDPSAALDRVRGCRIRLRDKLAGLRYGVLRIRGLTFSVAAPASVARPLAEWLYGYMAMIPEAVSVDPGSDPDQAEALRSFLESKGLGRAWGREPEECGAVLADCVTAVTMASSGMCRAGIPITYASLGLDDIIPRPVYGIAGALYILDEVFHGTRGM